MPWIARMSESLFQNYERRQGICNVRSVSLEVKWEECLRRVAPPVTVGVEVCVRGWGKDTTNLLWNEVCASWSG